MKQIRRSVLLPGEGYAEYVAAKMASKSATAFDARRLVINGWTADRERHFQKFAHACMARLHDGVDLIDAIQNEMIRDEQDRTARTQAREEIDRRLEKENEQ